MDNVRNQIVAPRELVNRQFYFIVETINPVNNKRPPFILNNMRLDIQKRNLNNSKKAHQLYTFDIINDKTPK